MAFGSGSRSYGPNAVLYSFKIKTKDLPAPLFEVSKKVGDKYEVMKGPITTRVSGNLTGAQLKEHTHEGKLIKSLNLTVQDVGVSGENDVYFVSVGYTFLGRNLFNSLLNLKTFAVLEISLYQSKPKPGAADQRGFASVALRQEGELVKGRFDFKTQLPQTKKVRVNGKDQTDTFELDERFEAELKTWCKVVNAVAPKPVAAGAGHAEESEPATQEAGSENPSGEPPF